MKGLIGVTAIALLLAACGRDSATQQPGQDGAVGTSGRTPSTVSAVLRAEPPVFVSHDREGTRLWTITQQFYQKRGETLAWIDGTKPRPAMDELIATLEKADRDGLDPALYSASTLSARRVALNTAAPMAARLIDAAFALIYLRLLGRTDVGAYTFLVVLTTYFDTLVDFGLNALRDGGEIEACGSVHFCPPSDGGRLVRGGRDAPGPPSGASELWCT